MSSKQTTRSGRTVKPPKRLIEEEPELVNTKRLKKSKDEEGLCFVNAIVAVIAGVTVLISSGLLLYYSVYDYMYSPAPIKPMTTLEKLVGITIQPLLSISKWMTESDLF